jgi:hypothetical protein
MKDDKGLYYYPFPQNKGIRMYVREDDGIIYFRLWNAEDPMMWEEHGWVPYGAIKQATAMVDRKKFDPSRAYDLEAAKMLFKTNR